VARAPEQAETIKAEAEPPIEGVREDRGRGFEGSPARMADQAKEELAHAEAVKRELDDLLRRVPNLFYEVRACGQRARPTTWSRGSGVAARPRLYPRTHYDLGETLESWTSSTRHRVTGSRFAFLLGRRRAPERALGAVSCLTSTRASTDTPRCGRRCSSTARRWSGPPPAEV